MTFIESNSAIDNSSFEMDSGGQQMKTKCIFLLKRIFKCLFFILNIADIVYCCEQLALLVYLFFYHYDYFISNMSNVIFSCGMYNVFFIYLNHLTTVNVLKRHDQLLSLLSIPRLQRVQTR